LREIAKQEAGSYSYSDYVNPEERQAEVSAFINMVRYDPKNSVAVEKILEKAKTIPTAPTENQNSLPPEIQLNEIERNDSVIRFANWFNSEIKLSNDYKEEVSTKLEFPLSEKDTRNILFELCEMTRD